MPYLAPNNKVFEKRIGSRVEVKRGKAYMTSGNLKANDIIVNSAGRYVSAAKHAWGKTQGKKQLEDSGYALFNKGAPGVVKKKTKRTGRKRK